MNAKTYHRVGAHSKSAKGNPLVSIITVCRNSEKTISRTMESVLRQTYSDCEYIVIDGASDDRTINIIKEYAPQFRGKMRWRSEKDDGIYDAMNKGIRLANGVLLGILNADDWYEDTAVEDVVRVYRENKETVIYGIMRYVENGKEVMLKMINSQFLYREFDGHPTYFVCRKLYEQYGVFQTKYKYAADYELMLRFLDRKVPFVPINKVLANFSLGGTSSKKASETLMDSLKIRRTYGFITRKQFMINALKARVVAILRKGRLLV